MGSPRSDTSFSSLKTASLYPSFCGDTGQDYNGETDQELEFAGYGQNCYMDSRLQGVPQCYNVQNVLPAHANCAGVNAFQCYDGAFAPPIYGSVAALQEASSHPCLPAGMPVFFFPAQQAPAPLLSAPSLPRSVAAAKTTINWKNIPNNYSRDGLLSLINGRGFSGRYDFFYAPVDFTSNALVGYAFINFVSPEDADSFMHAFENFGDWELKSDKVSKVVWSNLQGLDKHIERYRNSPVMHDDVADGTRPVLFENGCRIAFPLPTKKLRPPHLKDCRPRA